VSGRCAVRTATCEEKKGGTESVSSFVTIGSCGVQFLAACEVLRRRYKFQPAIFRAIFDGHNANGLHVFDACFDVYGLLVRAHDINNLADIGIGGVWCSVLIGAVSFPSPENEFVIKLAHSSCSMRWRRRHGRAPSHCLGCRGGLQIGAKNVREKRGEKSGCRRWREWQRACQRVVSGCCYFCYVLVS
jgi:hypothetical protein